MKCALVYYSYSGVTKKVIQDMNKIISGTVIEVTPDKPYNTLLRTRLDASVLGMRKQTLFLHLLLIWRLMIM